jgi:hypothetical protein
VTDIRRSTSARERIVGWPGLARALRRVLPPAAIMLGLILLISRPIDLWIVPVVALSAATLAWFAQRDLARFLLGFVAFTALRHLADDIGPVAYVQYPIVLDRLLGLGTLPSVWAQANFSGLVYPAVVVYMSYFFVPPFVVGLLWGVWPDQLRSFVSATLALFFLAALVHIVAPTAPPWIAAQLGAVGGVRPVVLDYYRSALPTAYQLGTGVSSNMVAAMPSVHLGVTTLIACALWHTVLRWPAVVYLVVMAITVVYTGDHYVVDVLAGVALAIGCWRWASRRRTLGPLLPSPGQPAVEGQVPSTSKA